MSQLTRDRLLAALGVPRASREELGELSYEGHADLLGCKTRLTAIAESTGVSAKCEMQQGVGAPWILAWRWAVQETPDGRMRLSLSDYPSSPGSQKAPASIEDAKALTRAAILQIRENPLWTKTGLACGPEADFSRFAALAHGASPTFAIRSASDKIQSKAANDSKKGGVLHMPVASSSQTGLFGDEPAPQNAFKR